MTRWEMIEKAQTSGRSKLHEAYDQWQADYKRIFAEAGLTVQAVIESSNRYCGDDCCPHLPALSIETQIGTIEFWWRKRVSVINWESSRCTDTAETLFPDSKDTKGGREIHCWSYVDVTLRLTKIREIAEKRDVFASSHDPNKLVECIGCGHYVFRPDIVEMSEYTDTTCERCAKCEKTPELRESYRRGFNRGLEALGSAVKQIVESSGLRKRDPR